MAAIIVKDWLDKQAAGSRTARSALNKGRTLQPAVGDTVHFDPICKLGRHMAKYRGEACKVTATDYDSAASYPNAPPLVKVEFADTYHYWINPWHLVD